MLISNLGCLTYCVHAAYVLEEVTKAGFTEPTPIQAQGWPMALLGRDLVCPTSPLLACFSTWTRLALFGRNLRHRCPGIFTCM